MCGTNGFDCESDTGGAKVNGYAAVGYRFVEGEVERAR